MGRTRWSGPTVTIKVADIHALPAVAMMVTDKDGKADDPQPTSVTEGDTIYVAVTVVDKRRGR